MAGLLALLSALPLARSQDRAAPVPEGQTRAAAVSIDEVEIGFHGAYKIGEWTPLWATMRSDDERQVTLVIDAPDPDDNLTSLPGPSFDLKSGSPVRCETSFRTGRLSGELHVRVQDSRGHTLASRRLRAANAADSELRPALRLDRPLWITLGNLDVTKRSSRDADADADADAAAANPESAREPRIVRYQSLQELPADWRSLQSVDLLILPTGKAAGGGSLLGGITTERNALLQKWVGGGGHLLISVGSETAAFRESPLAAWMAPIVVEGQSPLRQLSSLEAFAGQHAPLKVSGTVMSARLGRLPAANVVVRQPGATQPLVASVPYGFGRLTVVGVDIDIPPLSDWPALRSVLEKLAGGNAHSAPAAARKLNRQLTHVGVTDLATQFQQTHEDFPAVRRLSYWWVMGLILLYVALIGPVDYLFVHGLLRRPELTWLTFPMLAGAAFAAAVWEASSTNGRDLLVNQFDLFDIDSQTSALRARTWVSLYSPEHRRFSVAVEPDVGQVLGGAARSKSASDVQMSWVAPPENAVGGMYRSGAASFGGRGYRFAPAAAHVENIPVAKWSARTLSTAWSDVLPEPVVDCRLETFGAGQLKGTIAHNLNVPLEDCLLVVGGWAYLPTTTNATLKPHAAWRPSGESVRQRDLKALLTGEQQMRRTREGSRETELTTTTEIYNPLARDRAYQVRMLSFHEAAGGTDYTGLADAALRSLELTDIMQLGRGVLIGRIPSAAARVAVDGKPAQPAERDTWVRLVFPVKQRDAAVEKTIPNLNEQLRPSSPPAGKPL
ncbi:MAG: hypothetical protein ACM3U2_13700 [Deltaproteobacteria bacterium]